MNIYDLDEYKKSKLGFVWISASLFVLTAFALVFLFRGDSFTITPHNLGLPFEAAAAGLGIWIAILIGVWVHRQGKFDLFELPVWISLNIYIQVVLNVWLFQRDLKLTSPWLINNASAMAVKAIFLFGFSLTVFWSAYIWVSERLQRHSHIIQIKAYEPRKTIIIGIWVITWLITTLSVVLGVQGYLPSITSFAWTNYLRIISLLGDLVTFILLLYHFRHPTLIGRCWLVFVCSTSVFLGLVVGTKGAIFIFLYLVMALYYAQNRIPKAWLSVGLLILFIIVPVVNTFRSSLFAAGYNRSTGANFSERLLVLSDSTNQVITQPISMLAGQTGDTFKARQGSIMEITMAMLAVHPTHRPYVGSDILLELANNFIPRVFWPGKPTYRPEIYLILSNYLGASTDTTFADTGQFGDAYRAGGWIFVVIWFGSLGALAAWLYRQGPKNGSLPGIAFYLLVLTSILTYSGNVFQTITDLLKLGIPIWIFTMYILFKPVHSHQSNDQNFLQNGIENKTNSI